MKPIPLSKIMTCMILGQGFNTQIGMMIKEEADHDIPASESLPVTGIIWPPMINNNWAIREFLKMQDVDDAILEEYGVDPARKFPKFARPIGNGEYEPPIGDDVATALFLILHNHLNMLEVYSKAEVACRAKLARQWCRANGIDIIEDGDDYAY